MPAVRDAASRSIRALVAMPAPSFEGVYATMERLFDLGDWRNSGDGPSRID